jgi:uncharacterized protein (DUF2237 family)
MKGAMKKLVLTLALAGLATSPALAQRRAVPPPPGGHDEAGVLILYGTANFSGQSQRITGAQASLSTPFAIRSLSIHPGDRWQICANRNFQGPCTTVTRPIQDATIIGVTGQVGSIRLVPDPNAPSG